MKIALFNAPGFVAAGRSIAVASLATALLLAAGPLASPATGSTLIAQSQSTTSPADVAPTATAPQVDTPADLKSAYVVRVVNGDTVVVRMATGVRERVRLIGSDAPEFTQVYGKQARRFTEQWLPVGSRIYIERGEKKYDSLGRLQSYVWLSRPTALNKGVLVAKMLNAKLMSEGYASHVVREPNTRYAELFGLIAQDARSARTGLSSPAIRSDRSAAKTVLSEYRSYTAGFSNGLQAGVWVNEKGDEYHLYGCNRLGKKHISLTLSDALTAGHTPCSRCEPPYPIARSVQRPNLRLDLPGEEYRYVGSVLSNRYHYPTCYFARHIETSNEVWFPNTLVAISQGYSPCLWCEPPWKD